MAPKTELEITGLADTAISQAAFAMRTAEMAMTLGVRAKQDPATPQTPAL